MKLWLMLASTPLIIFCLAVIYGHSNLNKSVVNINDWDYMHGFNDDDAKIELFHIPNIEIRGLVLPTIKGGQSSNDHTDFNLIQNIQQAKKNTTKIFHFELLQDKINKLAGERKSKHIPDFDSLEKDYSYKVSDLYPTTKK